MGVDDLLTLEVGGMQVLTSPGRWDALRTQAPVPATVEDMRDFAIGELERIANEAKGWSDDTLVERYGAAAAESIEADVLDAEIDRRGLDL